MSTFIALVLFMTVIAVVAQVVQANLVPFGQVCEDATTCLECMNMATGCGYWQPNVVVGSTSAGICADRCLIADLACYSKYGSYNAGKTATEICQQADKKDATKCEDITTCLECMNTAIGCGYWQPSVVVGSTSEGICGDRCMIADLACYSKYGSYNVGKTSTEICQKVDNDKFDAERCGRILGCNACVATIKTDGSSTCKWLAEWNLCVSECGQLGCGEARCTAATIPGDILVLP